MIILRDHYMVTIDQEYDSVRMKNGLVSLNAAYLEDDQEKKYQFKRQWGTVVRIPPAFSNTVHDLIDTGIPQRRKFIPSEFIQMKANQGFTKLPKYWPTTFDKYNEITRSDLGAKMSVKVGDRVYLDYLVSEKENLLGKHKGKNMYQVGVDQIYCVVRRERSRVDYRYRNNITMQGGWVLVEPDVETWDEIMTDNGLLKKPKPEAKALLGFVRHIDSRPDVKRGDHIVYARNADYVVVVEGKSYFVMKDSDILCKV